MSNLSGGAVYIGDLKIYTYPPGPTIYPRIEVEAALKIKDITVYQKITLTFHVNNQNTLQVPILDNSIGIQEVKAYIPLMAILVITAITVATGGAAGGVVAGGGLITRLASYFLRLAL
ncbi:MAG: hypothetical protein RR437_08740 [Clostridium sp.]